MLPLARQIGQNLVHRGFMLTSAESCTGGLLGEAVTAISGSSAWYERGFITYSNASKCEMLGVRSATLEQYGAVSEQTAQEMAAGAIIRSHAQVSVAITGIAGPSGGTIIKPVGMICFAWAVKADLARSQTRHLSGDRQEIRQQSVIIALQGILDLLHETPAGIA